MCHDLQKELCINFKRRFPNKVNNFQKKLLKVTRSNSIGKSSVKREDEISVRAQTRKPKIITDHPERSPHLPHRI